MNDEGNGQVAASLKDLSALTDERARVIASITKWLRESVVKYPLINEWTARVIADGIEDGEFEKGRTR